MEPKIKVRYILSMNHGYWNRLFFDSVEEARGKFFLTENAYTYRIEKQKYVEVEGEEFTQPSTFVESTLMARPVSLEDVMESNKELAKDKIAKGYLVFVTNCNATYKYHYLCRHEYTFILDPEDTELQPFNDFFPAEETE